MQLWEWCMTQGLTVSAFALQHQLSCTSCQTMEIADQLSCTSCQTMEITDQLSCTSCQTMEITDVIVYKAKIAPDTTPWVPSNTEVLSTSKPVYWAEAFFMKQSTKGLHQKGNADTQIERGEGGKGERRETETENLYFPLWLTCRRTHTSCSSSCSFWSLGTTRGPGKVCWK